MHFAGCAHMLSLCVCYNLCGICIVYFDPHCYWSYCITTFFPSMQIKCLGSWLYTVHSHLSRRFIRTHTSSPKSSKVVSHPSNVLAQFCLTSAIKLRTSVSNSALLQFFQIILIITFRTLLEQIYHNNSPNGHNFYGKAFLTYLYLDNVFDKVTPTHENLSMKNDLITFKELSIQMY